MHKEKECMSIIASELMYICAFEKTPQLKFIAVAIQGLISALCNMFGECHPLSNTKWELVEGNRFNKS